MFHFYWLEYNFCFSLEFWVKKKKEVVMFWRPPDMSRKGMSKDSQVKQVYLSKILLVEGDVYYRGPNHRELPVTLVFEEGQTLDMFVFNRLSLPWQDTVTKYCNLYVNYFQNIHDLVIISNTLSWKWFNSLTKPSNRFLYGEFNFKV